MLFYQHKRNNKDIKFIDILIYSFIGHISIILLLLIYSFLSDYFKKNIEVKISYNVLNNIRKTSSVYFYNNNLSSLSKLNNSLINNKSKNKIIKKSNIKKVVVSKNIVNKNNQLVNKNIANVKKSNNIKVNNIELKEVKNSLKNSTTNNKKVIEVKKIIPINNKNINKSASKDNIIDKKNGVKNVLKPINIQSEKASNLDKNLVKSGIIEEKLDIKPIDKKDNLILNKELTIVKIVDKKLDDKYLKNSLKDIVKLNNVNIINVNDSNKTINNVNNISLDDSNKSKNLNITQEYFDPNNSLDNNDYIVKLCNIIKDNIFIPPGFENVFIDISWSINSHGIAYNISSCKQGQPIAVYTAIKQAILRSRYSKEYYNTNIKMNYRCN